MKFIKNKELMLLTIYMFILESVFVLENKLQYTFLFVFSSLFILCIIALLGLILPRKFRIAYIYSIVIFFPIYLIGQDIYSSIFSDFFSAAEIVSLKEGLEFASGVIYFKLIYLFYILMPIIFTVIYNKVKTKDKNKLTSKMLYLLIIPVILFLLVLVNMQHAVKEARLYTSDAYLYSSVYNKQKLISKYGVTNYFIRDIVKSITPIVRSNKRYDKDISKYFITHHKDHSVNDYTGIFKDKNLIFITSESFDYIALNETLMPNISRLMKEGLNFQNYNVPVYPRTTCDTETIYNTGIIPSINDGPTCYIYNKNSYKYSLANIFKKSGYITRGFHSNDKEFYTRNLVYKGFGYDKFYGEQELKLSETEKRYDSIFIEKAKDYIMPSKDKFLSFVMTLSGHSPYNKSNLAVAKHYDEAKKYYEDMGKTAPDEIIAYTAAQMELDLFVGSLVKDLTEKGLLDNTVIILTADHYPYTLNNNVYESYTGIKDKYLKSRAPLVIWSKQITPQVINTMSQSFDMLPTIANLFDLPVDYTYYFGNDIFSSSHKPLVYYKDYSWYDGNNYVSFGKKIVGNGKESYIKDTTKAVDAYFNVSKEILRDNYFKY